MGGTGQRATALIEGRVAGAMLSPPFDERAAAAGCRVLVAGSRVLPGYPGTAVVARRSWAAAHADLLTAFHETG